MSPNETANSFPRMFSFMARRRRLVAVADRASVVGCAGVNR